MVAVGSKDWVWHPADLALFAPTTAQILKCPGAFALRTTKRFRANQGPLLAGAVAFYALLSIVPLLILTVSVGNLALSGDAL
jgi:uncharacterized BrkB/YihY/UPF0761 family membrane protein